MKKLIYRRIEGRTADGERHAITVVAMPGSTDAKLNAALIGARWGLKEAREVKDEQRSA